MDFGILLVGVVAAAVAFLAAWFHLKLIQNSLDHNPQFLYCVNEWICLDRFVIYFL
jgi:hypothetical protein